MKSSGRWASTCSRPRSSTSASDASDGLELDQRALIGDTAGVALTGADGTIDWWCRDRPDADPLLWRLLDPRGPAVGLSVGGPPGLQRYEERSLAVRTELAAGEQLVSLVDFMPWTGASPPGRIVRIATARRGPALVRIAANPGAGDDVSAWSEGVAFGRVTVRAGIPFNSDGTASTVLETGERLVMTIDDGSAPPLSPDRAADALTRTMTSWRRVIDAGDVTPAAATSVLVLRALSWLDRGPLVSAATTSLPEVAGDERNYDRRFASTVDVARWAAAASALGLEELAATAVTWLEEVVETGLPVADVLAVDGDPPAGERVPGWRGWRRSEPVRLGLDPPEQPSVEAAAAVLLAAAGRAGAPLLGHWDRLVDVADWLASASGTSLLRRRALAQFAEAAARRNPLDLDAAGWHAARAALDREMSGWGPTLPGTPSVDVLGAAWLGPWPPDDPVVASSVEETRRRLGVGPWLAPQPPAASVTATLRLARALACLGRWDEAHATVEAVDGLGGPLGLLPECVDPTTGRGRGNLPSAAAHLAYLETLAALQNRMP